MEKYIVGYIDKQGMLSNTYECLGFDEAYDVITKMIKDIAHIDSLSKDYWQNESSTLNTIFGIFFMGVIQTPLSF